MPGVVASLLLTGGGVGPPQGPLFWESSLSLSGAGGLPIPSGLPHSHPGKGSRLGVSLLEPWIPETKDSSSLLSSLRGGGGQEEDGFQ